MKKAGRPKRPAPSEGLDCACLVPRLTFAQTHPYVLTLLPHEQPNHAAAGPSQMPYIAYMYGFTRFMHAC
jgi:hypothetical protein